MVFAWTMSRTSPTPTPSKTATLSKMEGVEVLVLNALRPTPHYSHFSLSEALDVAEQWAPNAPT